MQTQNDATHGNGKKQHQTTHRRASTSRSIGHVGNGSCQAVRQGFEVLRNLLMSRPRKDTLSRRVVSVIGIDFVVLDAKRSLDKRVARVLFALFVHAPVEILRSLVVVWGM